MGTVGGEAAESSRDHLGADTRGQSARLEVRIRARHPAQERFEIPLQTTAHMESVAAASPVDTTVRRKRSGDPGIDRREFRTQHRLHYAPLSAVLGDFRQT